MDTLPRQFLESLNFANVTYQMYQTILWLHTKATFGTPEENKYFIIPFLLFFFLLSCTLDSCDAHSIKIRLFFSILIK